MKSVRTAQRRIGDGDGVDAEVGDEHSGEKTESLIHQQVKSLNGSNKLLDSRFCSPSAATMWGRGQKPDLDMLAKRGSNSLEHTQRVPLIICVFQARDDRLPCSNSASQICLRQAGLSPSRIDERNSGGGGSGAQPDSNSIRQRQISEAAPEFRALVSLVEQAMDTSFGRRRLTPL